MKKGQILLKFEEQGFQLGVEQARAGLAVAQTQTTQLKSDLNRVAELVGAEAAPQATLEQLSAQYEAAQAQKSMADVGLRRAQKALNDSILRAPYNGMIADILHEEGEYAPSMPQTMLVKIVDTSSLEVQIFLPEDAASFVSVGQPAKITVESAGLQTEGDVIFVSNRLQSGSQTFEVRIRLSNEDGKIKGGAFTRVELQRRSVPDAILIPLRAVYRNREGEPFVYLAEKSKAQVVPVALGESSGTQVLVTQGLVAGQSLITSQVTELDDGAPITVTGE